MYRVIEREKDLEYEPFLRVLISCFFFSMQNCGKRKERIKATCSK